MIECYLGNRKHTIEYVSSRALHEIEPALSVYNDVINSYESLKNGGSRVHLSIKTSMDILIDWFCLVFDNQFSPDDVLQHYPVDRLLHDIALLLIAVQTQNTDILSVFPTKATYEAPNRETQAAF